MRKNQLTERKFNSNGDEIRYYTLELLRSHKMYTRQHIKKYVTQRGGKNFPEGTFAGALSNLVYYNSKVISPKRGYYQLVKQEEYTEDDFNELTVATLERFIDEINELATSINPLHVTDKQQKIFNVLKGTLKSLNLSISEIETMINEKNTHKFVSK